MLSRTAIFRSLVLSLFLHHFLLTTFVPLCAQNAPKSAPPPLHPEIQALREQGQKAFQDNRNEDALRLFTEALERARTLKDRAGEGISLGSIGMIHSNVGRMPQAQATYEKALPIFREIGDRVLEARTLLNIGNVRADQGQTKAALPFYEQSLAIFRELGDRANEAKTLTNIAIIYDDSGQPQKALGLYRQSLTMVRQAGDRSGEATALSNLAYLYKNTGRLPEARDYFQQSLTIQRQLGSKSSIARLLSSLSPVYTDLGEPAKGLECGRESLRLHRQVGDRAGEAAANNQIANVYATTGQPERALPHYQNALTLHRTLGNRPYEAATLGNLGNIYHNLGQSEQALTYYRQSLRLHRQTENRQGEAGTLTNIGLLYQETGRQKEARTVYQQARTLFRALQNRLGEASALNGIGTTLSAQGQPRQALLTFQKARVQAQLSRNRAFEADTLTNIELSYTDLGQPKRAQPLLHQVLAIRQQFGDRQGEANALYNLSAIESSLGRRTEATRFLHQSFVLTERMREALSDYSEAQTTLLASRLKIYYRYMDALLQENRQEEAFAVVQKTKARALLDSLGSGKAALHRQLTPEEQEQARRLRYNCDTLNRAMVAEGVRNEVGAKKRFAALSNQLREAERARQAFEDALDARHADFAAKRVARTATVADVAKFLPADTALLEYVQMRAKDGTSQLDRFQLFVITADGKKTTLRAYPLPVKRDRLEKQIAAFRDACSDPHKPYSSLARELYRWLLQPAEKQIAGKKRLLLCPDGALWDVPFAALISAGRVSGVGYRVSEAHNTELIGKRGSEKGKSVSDTRHPTPDTRHLWERFEIIYAYSATGARAVMTAQKKRAGKPGGTILALANPAFGEEKRFGDNPAIPGQRPLNAPSRPLDHPSRPLDMPSRPLESPSRPLDHPSRPLESPSRDFFAQRARGGIVALPGTQREADVIKRLFPEAMVYVQENAQEAAVKQEAGKYRYLHLASHAFFNDASPLLSSVVLADPKAGSEEDGFLTAREVMELDLNAEMVVLSACNTARGVTQRGEGVIGLTWALFMAGAPTTVVAQWSVDDNAAATLMTHFYTNLKAGQKKATALRNAALKLRTNQKTRHPYYWAPFLLVGNGN